MPRHKWFEVHLYPARPLPVPGQTQDRGRHYFSERGSRINEDASARTCDVDPYMGSSGLVKVICGIHADQIVKDVPELLAVVVQVLVLDKLICETFTTKDGLAKSKCDMYTSELEMPADEAGGPIRVKVSAACNGVATVPEIFEFRLRRKRASDQWPPTVDRFRQEARPPFSPASLAGSKRGHAKRALRVPQGLASSDKLYIPASSETRGNHAKFQSAGLYFNKQRQHCETLHFTLNAPTTTSHPTRPATRPHLILAPTAPGAQEVRPIASLSSNGVTAPSSSTSRPSSRLSQSDTAASTTPAPQLTLTLPAQQSSLAPSMAPSQPTSPKVKMEDNEMNMHGTDLFAPCEPSMVADVEAAQIMLKQMKKRSYHQ